MPTETLIERAYTLIQMHRVEEARPVLSELFKANADDAEAWALAAEIAPTSNTREEALRKVADMSADTRLAEWAINELSRLKGLQTTSARTAPPLPSVPDSWGASPGVDTWSRSQSSAPHREAVELPAIAPKPVKEMPEKAVASPQPLKLSKPLPTPNEGLAVSMAYNIRSLGGWIMIAGIFIFLAAAISPPFNHILGEKGILMGWVAIALMVIGGLVTGVGYGMKD